MLLARARRADREAAVDSLLRELAMPTEEVRVLSHLASTGSLTGPANGRGWAEQLIRELGRARRSGEALSVALLGLDDCKALNDSRGHQAGHRLLVEGIAGWYGQLRDVDIFCRWRDDEFAVLAPACLRARAEEVIAPLLRAAPNQHPCAAGVAGWDGRDTSESTVGPADKALLHAKSPGRHSFLAPALAGRQAGA
jgi:diguanylate cyclase (GGDEF)-like protein